MNPRRIGSHGPIAIIPEEIPDMTTEAETVCLITELNFLIAEAVSGSIVGLKPRWWLLIIKIVLL